MSVRTDDVVSKLRGMIPGPEGGSGDSLLGKASANVVSLMEELDFCLSGKSVGDMLSIVIPELGGFASSERKSVLSRLDRDEFMALIKLSISKAIEDSGVALAPKGMEVFEVGIDWEKMELIFDGLSEGGARRTAWSMGPCKNAWKEWAEARDIDFYSLEVSLGLESGSKNCMETSDGDVVRLNLAEGENPTYGWGNTKNGEVGVVRGKDGEELTVDFGSQNGWTGTGKELVLSRSSVFAQPAMAVGTLVRVNPGADSPFEGQFPWPTAKADDYGEITSVDHEDDTIKVHFRKDDGDVWISSRNAVLTCRKAEQATLLKRKSELEKALEDAKAELGQEEE